MRIALHVLIALVRLAIFRYTALPVECSGELPPLLLVSCQLSIPFPEAMARWHDGTMARWQLQQLQQLQVQQ